MLIPTHSLTHKGQDWPRGSRNDFHHSLSSTRQTSHRDLHEKLMVVLFFSACPGIVIVCALSESTGSGKSLKHKLFLTATLLLRGKYIRKRMMLYVHRGLRLRLFVTAHDNIM